MSKVKATIVALAIVAPLLLAFNNCGEVGFKDAGGVTTEVVGTSLSTEEADAILAALPPAVLTDEPRAVTDLELDPTLFAVYKCPDSDGVVICHFPENVEAYGTKCIGRAAVSSHYDHIRHYEMDGVSKTIGDYLGPCRTAL